MHPNAIRIRDLFTALHAHNHEAMAACYHPKARFRDIAFDLEGAGDIRDMWRMICRDETDMKVEIGPMEADDRSGRARVVEKYRFGASKADPEKGVEVTNRIESRFEFEEGLITSQIDDCDPKLWAKQAMGGPIMGFLPGRVRPIRSLVANWKLWKFRRANPG